VSGLVTTYTAGTGLTLVGTEFNTAGTGYFDSIAIATDGYIYHSGDDNTYIQFTNDEIQIAAGGRTYIKIEEDSVDKLILNHSALDIDLQVKGNNDANLIRTDAANDRVGIGKSAPDHKLDVDGVGSFESGIVTSGLITAATGIALQRNTPATTTDKLYNVGGALYFNGSAVDGDTTYTAGTGLTLVGTEFNTANTGNFDKVTFNNNIVRIGSDGNDDDGNQGIHIGRYAGAGQGDGAAYVINLGVRAGQNCGGDRNINIGYYGGYGMNDNMDDCIAIGRSAGQSADGGDKVIYLGFEAGYNANGDGSIYIGDRAGKNAVGSNNIEFVTDGASTSILDDLSNKIHIENTIVGDTDSRRLAIGLVGVGDVSPDATLEIKPSGTTTIGMIVQGAASHSANLTEWQNSSEGVLARVASDGIISGVNFIAPTGTLTVKSILFDDDKIRLGNQAGTDEGAHAIHIGEYAGFGQGTAASNVNIGYAAGYQHGGGYSISIGHTAGYQADNSAEFGIYLGYHAGRSSDSARGIFIGRNAGKNCTGDDNIEIVHYGAETSILDGYSDKIHIENTIVGDTDARRLAVGFVGSGDVVPDATLEIKPKEHTDIGLIVQGDTSHSANLTEWQNSSETVLAYVDKDGSVSGNNISASGSTIMFTSLPTSDPSNAGQLWRDGTDLKISVG
jgi:hypothetical protein